MNTPVGAYSYRDMRKQDKLNQARKLVMEHIDQSEWLPHFFKAQLKEVARHMFDPIRVMLGNMEILYRRTYKHKDELREIDGKAKDGSDDQPSNKQKQQR